jgi:DNA repair ATPase RecN
VDTPALLARLDSLATRLENVHDSLARSLGELPRADDFQPLADHLYEFARIAPPLLESLADVPRALGPIQESVRVLEQLGETLHFTHESFNESLMRLPRAEDYEPLAAPLAEFARVSPALSASLGEVLRLARPLQEAAQDLAATGARLDATEQRLGEAVARWPSAALEPTVLDATPTPTRPLAWAAAQALTEIDAARDALTAALDTLPTEPRYAAVAAQLRELASVSPSLMEWLAQTPALSAPLTASVAGLRDSARRLEQARQALADALAAERS